MKFVGPSFTIPEGASSGDHLISDGSGNASWGPAGPVISGSVSTATGSNIGNSSTEAALYSFTIPANAAKLNSVFEAKIWGGLEINNKSGVLNISARFGTATGGTEFLQTANSNAGLIAQQSNYNVSTTVWPWFMDMSLVCNATGSSGTMTGFLHWECPSLVDGYANGTGGGNNNVGTWAAFQAANTPVTFNTTASNTVTVTAHWTTPESQDLITFYGGYATQLA